VLVDAAEPLLAAPQPLPASPPAAQPLPAARRALAELARLREPKELEAAVSASRAPEAQPQAWPQPGALADERAEPEPQPLPSSG